MWINNLNSTDVVDNNSSKVTANTQNIEEQSLKISELNKEEEKQKSKEQVQAEIMSHFIQNPDENILMSMVISKDLEDGCEIVEFIDWEYEDEKMNDLFNWPFWIKVWWITIKADETWEKWEEFSKELVIDRKTNTKWILFIWKKWLKLEKFDFEDISKFEASFETYFVYKKEWKTLVKIIKNEIAKVNFRTTDWQSSDDIIFKQELLDKLTPEMIQQSQEGIMKLLKDAKQNWTLDMVVEMLSNQMPIREEMKKDLEEELYTLANSQ